MIETTADDSPLRSRQVPPPRRADAVRRKSSGARRRAAVRQAGAGLVPLQGRNDRDHGRDRRRVRQSADRTFVRNVKPAEVNTALAAMFLPKDKITIPYTPIVVNTGRKLVVIDTGTGEANLREAEGHRRPVPHQSGRRRASTATAVDVVDHLPLPRRPHQRPADGRRQAGVPERRDHGAGGEWKFLIDDGEMSRQTQRPHEGRVHEHPPGVRRARPQGDAIRSGQGSRARHHLGGDPWPHARSHVAHRLVRQEQGLRAGRRHQPAAVRAQSRLASMFDQDAKMAEATRRKVYDMLVAEKMMVQGFHYPFPALGPYREERIGLSRDPGALEPGALRPFADTRTAAAHRGASLRRAA